ncbi:MAG: CPBP family intramembrane metalloprotease [Lachnospiraceae bacterium]|nr:CPBP family intramembrane metalloprotease [Lachnospiraceae bacterium]
MRKHILVDKLPMVSAILLMLASMNLVDLGLAYGITLLPIVPGESFSIIYAIIRVAVSFLILLLFKLWFSPEYEGSVKLSGFAYGLKLLLPFIITWAVWLPLKGFIGLSEYALPNLDMVLVAILSGVGEEEACRGLGCALLLRSFKSEKKIWIPAVFSGVVFGLSHIINLNVTEDTLGGIGQIIFATMIGIAFGVVFTLSGSILPTMLIHSVYDIACAADIGNTNGFTGWENFVDLFAGVIIAGILLVTLYRKRDEAVALWSRKWKV